MICLSRSAFEGRKHTLESMSFWGPKTHSVSIIVYSQLLGKYPHETEIHGNQIGITEFVMSLFIVQNLKLLKLKPYFDPPPLSQGSYAFRPLGLALHHQPCPLLVLLASPPLTGHLPCLLVGPCLHASLQGLPGSPAYWLWPPTSFLSQSITPFTAPCVLQCFLSP